MSTTPFGFRVVGHRAGTRRLIDHAAAFRACAECDPRAELDRESFLSAFTFGKDFADYLTENASERGYGGPCGAPVVWWDVDRPDDLAGALNDSRRLAAGLLDRYRDFDEDDLLIFLSGGKGFHVGLPAVWRPAPSASFHDAARRFALAAAERAGIVVDGSIYTKTRLFRAPNSRHPKTGLHKRRLAFDELMHLRPERIVELARRPEPFDIPAGPARCQPAADDWAEAERAVERRAVERRARLADADGPKLNALTLAFIRDGADTGDRHRLLFSAAANLAEFGCPPALAEALLLPTALDIGLTPSDARRQIRCGLEHGAGQSEGGAP